MVEIIELNKDILEKKSNSYLATLENLKGYKKIDKQKLLKYFSNMEDNSKIFIAVNQEKEIIGTITILIEYKLIRGGVKAGRIEDIGVRIGYEGMGIGRLLIKEAINYGKKQGVYKITLSASEKVEGFYEKQGFQKSSTNFKMYI